MHKINGFKLTKICFISHRKQYSVDEVFPVPSPESILDGVLERVGEVEGVPAPPLEVAVDVAGGSEVCGVQILLTDVCRRAAAWLLVLIIPANTAVSPSADTTGSVP